MNDFTSRNPQPCSMAEKGSTTRPKISIVERGGGMVPYNYAKELNDDSLYKENNSCFVEFQATNGLILSAVMKHSSNLIRLLIIACAMSVNSLVHGYILTTAQPLLQCCFHFSHCCFETLSQLR